MAIETDIDFSWDETFDKEIFTSPEEEKIETEDDDKVSDVEMTEEEFLKVEEDERVEENINSKETNEDDSDNDKEDEKESENDDSETKESDDENDEIFTSLYSDLKENGILSIDLEEGETLDSEKFLSVFEKEMDKRVENEIQGFAEGFDEEAKAFLDFKKNGGNTVDFLKTFLSQTELPVESVESAEDQESFMRYYLRTEEEMDHDEIEEELELYKERSQLEKKANKAFQKVSNQINKEREEVLERQKQLKSSEEKSRVEFVKKLDTTLKETAVIGEFNITSEDKKELVDFIVKPSQEQTGKKVTGMQAKINEIYRDPQKLLLFAKLIKNDFDLSDIVKKAETKVTKKALDVVASKRKSGTPKVVNKGKYLADFFQ